MNLYLTEGGNGKDFFINDDDINIIPKINNTIINTKIKNNIDCILKTDGTSNFTDDENFLLDIAYLENIVVIGIPRLLKNKQAYLLNKYEINTPKTFFIDTYTQNSMLSLLKNYNNSDKFILKMLNGARGYGQILLTKEQYLKLLDTDDIDDTVTYLKHFDTNDIGDDKYESEPMSEVEVENIEEKTSNIKLEQIIENVGEVKVNNYQYISNLDSNYIVQEYLNIIEEYRLLWFYDHEPIFIKRDKDDGNWQANACNNKPNSSNVVYDRADILYLKNMFEDTLNKIDIMCKDLSIPYLSLDLFISEDKNKNTTKCGVLEFQMEFGYSKTGGLDLSVLHERIVNSVKKLYNDKK